LFTIFIFPAANRFVVHFELKTAVLLIAILHIPLTKLSLSIFTGCNRRLPGIGHQSSRGGGFRHVRCFSMFHRARHPQKGTPQARTMTHCSSTTLCGFWGPLRDVTCCHLVQHGIFFFGTRPYTSYIA